MYDERGGARGRKRKEQAAGLCLNKTKMDTIAAF